MALINWTIYEMFFERVKKTPDKIAVVFDNECYTWMELHQLSNKWAVYFLKKGVQKGTHTGIWSTNTPEWIVTFLALAKLGAVSVLINPHYKRYELEHLLAYAQVEYLCFGDGYKEICFHEIIEQIDAREFPMLKASIPIGHKTNINMDRSTLEQLSKEDESALAEAVAQVKPEDVLSILFTSGTTSFVKGVLTSHFALVNVALEVVRQMHWNEEDKICMSLPLFHCFGLGTGLLAGICAGTCIYLLEYYKTMNILECIDRHTCTILNGVPTMFMAIMRNARREEFDLSSLNTGIIGGSLIHPEEYLEVCKNIGIKRLQMSYGQTEASASITFSDFDDNLETKSISIGKPIENLEIQICSLATNTRLQIGEEGEILLKGYNIMIGYYHMPEETKKVLDQNGWLHTGDLGFIDEDGNLHITGRIKEMIIRCGENISPYEIEEHIRNYSGIDAVKVIGIDEEITQEEIVACIIPHKGETVDEQKLRDYLDNHLADYKVPKYIIQTDKFPINTSGKVALKELKEQVINIINKM